MVTVTMPKTTELSDGMKLLDLMPAGYDLSYVSQLFSSIGESGREYYLTRQIPVDMIYPLLFGISYSLLLGYLLKKLNKLNASSSYLCLLPLIAGLSDYLENIGIISMLKSYPDLTPAYVRATSTFSQIKSISMGVYFSIVIIVLLTLGISIINKKKRA